MWLSSYLDSCYVCMHVLTLKSLILPHVECNFRHTNSLLFLSQNGLEYNLRSTKFQNFPGGHAPKPPLHELSLAAELPLTTIKYLSTIYIYSSLKVSSP